EHAAPGSVAAPRVQFESIELPVIMASDEEVCAHNAVLDDLDKALKGTSVWRTEPAAVEENSADAQNA
ncbi:MAG TPA: DNA polymerase III subunit epsilon, partial [Paraburkholderia sp.]